MAVPKAVLVLSDGSFYVGTAFGSLRESFGELVFNTSMTGYQEALTDPSYAGQILTFAYPLIGNYGISKAAFESGKIHLSGVVAKQLCDHPVHQDSVKSVDEFLKEFDVPAIAGVDTRAIVTKGRSFGVVPSAIVPLEGRSVEIAVESCRKELEKFDYSKTDFVGKVTRGKSEVFTPANEGAAKAGARFSVVLVDCGVKQNIVRELVSRGCEVTVVPARMQAKEILSFKPDGVVYSNGPGDPALMTYAVGSCREILGKVPVFGICLGHQILGHALSGKTYKLKFGHRGANQPVIDNISGKCFLTSQNHGFAVKDIPKGVTDWLTNLNDKSNEGLRCDEKMAFSVQFHPEAAPGPLDTRFLFDDFVKMMK
ncbi:MAG: glutamine-hydrolyzing carbamoyl-phosphate synthase small subunit [Candidatus Micrarchaeia archaeon]